MAGNWPASWVRCSSSVNFYDLQIETKVSLSLRNFVVALSVCVCVCVLSSTQVLQHTDFLLFFELSKKKTRKQLISLQNGSVSMALIHDSVDVPTNFSN